MTMVGMEVSSLVAFVTMI